jgi:SM-20-related protein
MSEIAMLDLQAFRDTPLTTEPFEFVVVPEFVRKEAFADLHRDFPRVDKGGSYPIEGLTYGPAFVRLVEALESDEMRHAVERKFNLDLSDCPTMLTVRGHGRTQDGQIHTDSLDKVITLLIYVNDDWPHDGGRLRLLRSATDIEDYVAEVPPVRGNLIVFRRSDTSYHGHLPASDRRLSMQMNWMIDRASRDSELKRHKRSALLKKLNPFG